jgi:hypothetical protein
LCYRNINRLIRIDRQQFKVNVVLNFITKPYKLYHLEKFNEHLRNNYMQTALDPYITGARQIEKSPVMKWANLNLANFIGREIKDISNEINDLLHKERSQWKPLLTKAMYYLSGAVSCAALLSGLIDFTIARAINSPLKLLANNKFILCLGISSSLSSLFHFFHQRNLIDSRTKVLLVMNKKWPVEKLILKDWLCDYQKRKTELNTLSQRATALLDTAVGEEKTAIETTKHKIDLAQSNVAANLELINNLPALPKYFLLS